METYIFAEDQVGHEVINASFVDVELCTEAAKEKEKLEQQFKKYAEQLDEVTLKAIERQSFFEKIAMKCLWAVRFLF